MLDACAEILDEDGYDGLTTTRIAQRAEVAIGSVYQFFPDKRAVAQSLALRNLESFGLRISKELAEGTFDDWSDTVGVIIDIYVDMHRTVPGFRVLRFGDVADINLLDSAADNNAVVADRLRKMIVDNFAVAETPELARALAISVEAADAVLKMAFRRNPDGDPEILAETERLIHGYLAAYIQQT